MVQLQQKFENTVTIITISFIVLVVIGNVFIGQPLYIESLNFIYSVQQGQTPFLNFLNQAASSVTIGAVIRWYLVILTVLIQKRKIHLIASCLFMMLTFQLVGIFKNSFSESRPFWYSHNIQNLDTLQCTNTFGNPSGHSWEQAVFLELLFTDFLELTGRWRIVGLLFQAIMFVAVPISRMYLGVHTGNQIMFGLLMGVSTIVIYRYYFKRVLYTFFQSLLLDKSATMKLKLFLFHILYLGAPVAVYQIARRTNLIDQNHLDNLNKYCQKKYTSQKLHSSALNHTDYFLVMGIFVGFSFLRAIDWRFIWGQWTYPISRNKWLSWFLRIIIETTLIVAPFLLTSFIKKLLPKYTYLAYFVGNIGSWLAGFMYVGLSEKLLVKFNIIELNEPDQK